MEVTDIHVAGAWSGGLAASRIGSGRAMVDLVAAAVGQREAFAALTHAPEFLRQVGDPVHHQMHDLALALDPRIHGDHGGG